VASPTKMGMLYVFDRITGKPVWPMPERKVEKGTAPGEWYAPTQPIPTRPKEYTRTGVTTDELIDFTPAMHEQALDAIKKYKIGPIYTPPVLSNPNGPIATIMVGAANGGTNWPGGSFNPENHTAYIYGCNDCMSLTALVPPPPGMTDLPLVEGLAGQKIVMVNAAGADAGAAVSATSPFKVCRCSSRLMRPSAPSIWTRVTSSGRSRMATRRITSATIRR